MLGPIEYDSGYFLRFDWCNYNQSQWCKDIMSKGFGANYGSVGCYNPRTKTICLGLEAINTAWSKNDDKDRVISALVDLLIHEEIHRAIHKITRSEKASRDFDILFTAVYQFELNREYFRYNPRIFNWFK